MTTAIEKLAGIFKVLGDPNRLGIVMSIGKGSRSVTEIIRITGLSQTLISFHLRALRNVELVKTKRSGPFIYYSLSDPALLDILVGLSTSKGLEERETPEFIPDRGLEKQRR